MLRGIASWPGRRSAGVQGILAAALILAAGCQPGSHVATDTAALTRLVYAAQGDGTIHVYDIGRSHQEVRTIQVFSCCADVRGAAAAASTHRFYVMYNRAGGGHVAAVDLLTDRVLWDRVLHSPGVDRGDVTPDGKTLYLPTWEEDANAPYELVVDALGGAETGRIPLPPRSHDTIVSLDGRRVFMETKSATSAMYVADTATNQVVRVIDGFCCSGVLAPFSINGKGTITVNDVNGYYGFQVTDAANGHVVASVPLVGTSGSSGHGIAWTPNEREVWVNESGNPFVHIFDMTLAPPGQTDLVRVSSDSPHWITFSLDGTFAYVAGRKGSSEPTDVINVTRRVRVGALSPSEDLLEVDFSRGAVAAVGKQFGVGRVTG